MLRSFLSPGPVVCWSRRLASFQAMLSGSAGDENVLRCTGLRGQTSEKESVLHKRLVHWNQWSLELITSHRLLIKYLPVKILFARDLFQDNNSECSLLHLIQRKESKHDLRHQHRVSVQRFETSLYEKLYIIQRIHCLESFKAIRCQRRGLC